MTAYNYEQLKPYVQFNDIDKVDEQVALFRQTVGYQLNKTDNKILTYMMQYAVRYPGVFYQLVPTIAKSLKLSVSTVKRVLKKLTTLGIVKRIPTKRKKGGKGATIFQFQFFKNEPLKMNHCGGAEKPCESKGENANSNSKPFISSNRSLKNNTYLDTSFDNQDVQIASKDIREMTLYNRMKYLLSHTVGNLNDFQEYCKVIYANTRRWLKYDSYKPHKEEIEQIAYESLKATVYATNVRKSRVGLLHGILNNKLEEFIDELVSVDVEESERNEGQITLNWLDKTEFDPLKEC